MKNFEFIIEYIWEYSQEQSDTVVQKIQSKLLELENMITIQKSNCEDEVIIQPVNKWKMLELNDLKMNLDMNKIKGRRKTESEYWSVTELKMFHKLFFIFLMVVYWNTSLK